ncbi:hypothetical protein C3B60_17670 [Cryobacterium zongtaii]|nr:hypothetical protein C3B60_17670 [Cryobacterium zongtaii]
MQLFFHAHRESPMSWLCIRWENGSMISQTVAPPARARTVPEVLLRASGTAVVEPAQAKL